MSRVAVIGLGEAGVIYAEALSGAGHHVMGFDPVAAPTIDDVTLAGSGAEAVASADAVLVLTSAAASPVVFDECLPALREGALYIDMTSAAPHAMSALGDRAPEGVFVDAAILGAVIALRAATPLIVSGPRSAEAATLLASVGAPVTDVGGSPGDATARKLVRSVAAKGFAAVVCEAMDAARAAGFGDWMRDQCAALLPGDGHVVVDRYESGTRKHAVRRAMELDEVGAYLGTLGVPSDMADAAGRVHRRYAEDVAS